MWKLLTIFLALCSPYLEASTLKPMKLTDKLKEAQPTIDYINSLPENTWKAELSFDAESTVGEFINSRLGLKDISNGLAEDRTDFSKSIVNFQASGDSDSDNFTLPESYDVRKRYPECVNTAAIKDQANCGSCWAVSISSALSDRFCIQSHGKISVNLSANYFTACSEENYGCDGGYMNKAHDFLVTNGLITGGDYESDEGCQTYQIRPCGYYDTLPCTSSSALTPKCKNTACNNEFYGATSDDKIFKAKSYKQLPNNELEIRKEIYTNGPVVAGFTVYSDFMFYKKGIYQQRSYWALGGHAVKIIGWGKEKGLKYWLVSNSWSHRWGEDGLFRIIRGTNDSGFEARVHAAVPLIK